jgi:hypothetical protein
MRHDRELQQVFPRPLPEGPEPVRRAARPERAPEFRINRSDLAFLRSIDIDPTRRHR